MIRIIVTEHAGFQLNEYEVDISQDMRDKALAFASKIKLDDNQYNRLIPREYQTLPNDNEETIRRKERLFLKYTIQRTYVGKLGELAFLVLLNERGLVCNTEGMFEIYEGQANTDSFDFLTANNKTIDVKTGFRNNHSRLLINQQQFERNPKDIYVGVKLNGRDVPGDDRLIEWDSVRTAIIKGYAERSFLQRLNYVNYGEGPAKAIQYNQLLGIDRLLDGFNDMV